MAETTTYYAIIDDSSSEERPAGVLRRVQSNVGKIDEVFSGALRWVPSPLLRSAEHGDITNDFTEISEAEAEQIVARIRASVAEAEE
jgi:hypothetical protein